MKVYRREVRDCIQAIMMGGVNDTIDMPCLHRTVEECWTCGFYLPVAEERRKRIVANDWSRKKTKQGKTICYLKIGEKHEQSNSDGPTGQRS